MFDEKVILTRLQNGESVEDIAKELAISGRQHHIVQRVLLRVHVEAEACSPVSAEEEQGEPCDACGYMQPFVHWLLVYPVCGAVGDDYT